MTCKNLVKTNDQDVEVLCCMDPFDQSQFLRSEAGSETSQLSNTTRIPPLLEDSYTISLLVLRQVSIPVIGSEGNKQSKANHMPLLDTTTTTTAAAAAQ